jgi:excisionase family DNA binding protein
MRARAAYLTIQESASTLRVSERTVRRWIARGALPARKLGGTVRVPRSVLTDAVLSSAIRPRRGRPRRGASQGLSSLSDEPFARTWDNPEDAVYDHWRDLYGVRQG